MDSTLDARGVAAADLDGDGRLDLVINNNNAWPTIYLNRLRTTNHWLKVLVRGKGSNRDAIGARVTVSFRADGRRRDVVRMVEAGSGYASQSDTTLHFGLGSADSFESIEVRWPNGDVQTIAPSPASDRADQSLIVEEGNAPLVASRIVPRIARSTATPPTAAAPIDRGLRNAP